MSQKFSHNFILSFILHIFEVHLNIIYCVAENGITDNFSPIWLGDIKESF